MKSFDKKKYIDLVNTQSLSAALTVLHKDLWDIEFDTFEGPEGWKPQQWALLNEMRLFSRDLWEYGLELQNQQKNLAQHK